MNQIRMQLDQVCEATLSVYSIILLICVLGTFGNILAFLGFREEKKQTATSFLFQCLALADTLFLVLFAACSASDAITQCSGIMYSQYYRCHHQAYLFYIAGPLIYMAHVSSVWILVFLSVIRFTAVVFPHHLKSVFALARVKCICGIAVAVIIVFEMAWFVITKVGETGTKIDKYANESSVLAMPNEVHFTTSANETRATDIPRSDLVHANENCITLMPRNDLAYTIYVSGFTRVLHVYVPVLALYVLTILIIIALWRRNRAKKTKGSATRKRHQDYRNTTRTLVIILVLFCICITLGMGHVTFTGSQANHVWFFVARCLLVINSSINSVVYVVLSAFYRKLILRQLLGICNKVGEEGADAGTGSLPATGDSVKMT